LRIGALRMKRGEGITGWVAEHKSVVALGRRAYDDPRFKKFPTLEGASWDRIRDASYEGRGG